jgi:ribose transport system ATP-binding protein
MSQRQRARGGRIVSSASALGVVGELAARASSISKRFPGTLALDAVDLRVRRGTIHGLLGGNGSGKSTLIKIMSGVYAAEPGGRLVIGATEGSTESWSAHLARQAGVHVVHQDLGVFADLSVAENLSLGHGYDTSMVGTVRWSRLHRRAAELIERFEIDAAPRTPLRSLSQSNRTLVAIARALQGGSHEDSLLILDEPTSSLPAHEVDQLHAHLRRFAAAGQAIVYVTHRLDEVLSLTDRVTALRDGRVVGNADTKTLSEDDLVRMIVGADIESLLEHDAPRRRPEEKPVLELRKLSTGPLRDIDLDVRRGEIVGIAGLLGSGRSSVLRTVFGAAAPASGSVLVGGKEVAFSHVRQAIEAGVAYVPENRADDAAFPDLPVYANITMARIRAYWRRWRMRKASMRSDARELIREFQVKAPSERAPFATLSGGNQQKVIVARWLAHRPILLLLDEPTQGVDVQARAEIYGLVRRAAEAGTSVVVVASDFEELAHVVDRAIVLRDGSVVGSLDGRQITAARLTQMAYASVGGDRYADD